MPSVHQGGFLPVRSNEHGFDTRGRTPSIGPHDLRRGDPTALLGERGDQPVAAQLDLPAVGGVRLTDIGCDLHIEHARDPSPRVEGDRTSVSELHPAQHGGRYPSASGDSTLRTSGCDSSLSDPVAQDVRKEFIDSRHTRMVSIRSSLALARFRRGINLARACTVVPARATFTQ